MNERAVKRIRWMAGLVSLLAGGVSACSTGEDAQVAVGSCIPGETNACLCETDLSGVQICLTEGVYGACECRAPEVAFDAGSFEPMPSAPDLGQLPGSDLGASDVAHADLGLSDAGARDLGLADGSILDTGASEEVGIVAVAAGAEHTCIALASGQARCWGANGWGQLGDGTTTYRASPTPVRGITSAVKLAAGGAHTCALLRSGEARCWGYNDRGQLGTGMPASNYAYTSTPTPVLRMDSAVAIAAAPAHTCVSLRSGEMECWGDNRNGQLGTSTPASLVAPRRIANIGTAVAVGAGGSFSCGILASRNVECWGGLSHRESVCVRRNSWGDCLEYQWVNHWQITPVRMPTDSALTVSVASDRICATLASGELRCWDNPKVRRAVAPDPSAGHVIAYGMGGGHRCALLESGKVVCWGSNGDGQLGIGEALAQTYPALEVFGISSATGLAVGSRHACAIIAGEALECWGSNLSGQLGDGTTTARATPVRIPL